MVREVTDADKSGNITQEMNVICKDPNGGKNSIIGSGRSKVMVHTLSSFKYNGICGK